MWYNRIVKCKTCGETKDLELFTRDKKAKNGRRKVCKQCDCERMKKYYRDNPDKAQLKREMNKGKPQWKSHKMTEEQYNEMFQRHDGKCHVCLTKDAKVVDHDHNCCSKQRSCGKCVRGLLCHGCNMSLGNFQDDTSILFRAISYLSNPV